MQLRPPDKPQYIGAPDTTFAGSRNAHSALAFWDYHARHSLDDQIAVAVHAQRVAEYAHQQLLQLQTELGMDLYVARSPLALTVRFRQANDQLCRKYSLSNESLTVEGQARPYSHIFTMAGTTEAQVDALVADLRQPGAFAPLPAHREPKPAETEAERLAEKKSGHALHHKLAKRLQHVPTFSRGYK